MALSRAFQKCIIFHFLDKFSFANYITGFCDKIFNFCKFAKVEHKSFPMMYHLSYLDIKHGIQSQRILIKHNHATYSIRTQFKMNNGVFMNKHRSLIMYKVLQIYGISYNPIFITLRHHVEKIQGLQNKIYKKKLCLKCNKYVLSYLIHVGVTSLHPTCVLSLYYFTGCILLKLNPVI